MSEIKIYQVDDWAYVAANSKEDAEAYMAEEFERPEDPDDWECEERIQTPDIKALLDEHIAEDGKFPALIGIDAHYA